MRFEVHVRGFLGLLKHDVVFEGTENEWRSFRSIIQQPDEAIERILSLERVK